MNKVILLDDHFNTGEQTVQPVLSFGLNKQDFGRITKHASEAMDYIKNVMPEPGKTHMLVLALGASETYGANRNGDAFSEHPVAARRNATTENAYWVAPGEEVTKHYQTFEKGHAFKHHVNKDPAKASGRIKKAFWNPKMHRIELLIVIDNDKDPEWVERVNDGDFPAVSMGCRIKYDVCSLCGNKAPTRKEYCDDIKLGMNRVNPDGTKNFVYNPSPDFFDISRVFRPADRTGFTLKKVANSVELWSGYKSAELGDVAEVASQKSAIFSKLSDITKIVKGEPVASSGMDGLGKFKQWVTDKAVEVPSIPVKELSAAPLAQTLSALSKAGILLTTPEFLTLVIRKLSSDGVEVSPELIRSFLAHQSEVFNLFAQSPALFDNLSNTPMFQGAEADSKTAKVLEKYTKRANLSELLARTIPDSIGVRPQDLPNTDLLHVTDPATHATRATTRGAMISAHDAIAKERLMKTLGASSLLLGAYGALSMHPGLRAGAMGAAALSGRQNPTRMMATDEGLNVPDRTELSPLLDPEKTGMYIVNSVDEHRRYGKRAKISTTRCLPQYSPFNSIEGARFDFDDVCLKLGASILANLQ